MEEITCHCVETTSYWGRGRCWIPFHDFISEKKSHRIYLLSFSKMSLPTPCKFHVCTLSRHALLNVHISMTAFLKANELISIFMFVAARETNLCPFQITHTCHEHSNFPLFNFSLSLSPQTTTTREPLRQCLHTGKKSEEENRLAEVSVAARQVNYVEL